MALVLVWAEWVTDLQTALTITVFKARYLLLFKRANIPFTSANKKSTWQKVITFYWGGIIITEHFSFSWLGIISLNKADQREHAPIKSSWLSSKHVEGIILSYGGFSLYVLVMSYTTLLCISADNSQFPFFVRMPVILFVRRCLLSVLYFSCGHASVPLLCFF